MAIILKPVPLTADWSTLTDQCASNFKQFESELLQRIFLDVDLEVSLRTFIEIGSFIKFLNFLKIQMMIISIRYNDDKIIWWQGELVTRCDEIICLLWSVWGIKFKSLDLSVTLISNLVAPILQLFDLDSWLNCNPRTKDYFK